MSTHICTRTWRIEGGRLSADKVTEVHDFISRPGFVKTVKVEVDRITVSYDASRMPVDRGKMVAGTVARAVVGISFARLRVVEVETE